MPTIRFTSDPKLPSDLQHLGYAKGQEHNLPSDQCERWVRRDVAEYVSAEELADRKAAAEKAAAEKAGAAAKKAVDDAAKAAADKAAADKKSK